MEAVEDKDINDATLGIKTLSERLLEATARGYTENFKITGKFLSGSSEKNQYTSKQVIIFDFFRFEGYSDPQDSSILYLIETMDGRKGALIDAYGAYADSAISNFVKEIELMEMKPKDKVKKVAE